MTTNENGLGQLVMTPTQQGVYQVRAVSGENVDVQTVFAVSARIAELEDIQPNHQLMQQLVAQYKANGTDAVWMSEYDELQTNHIHKSGTNGDSTLYDTTGSRPYLVFAVGSRYRRCCTDSSSKRRTIV